MHVILGVSQAIALSLDWMNQHTEYLPYPTNLKRFPNTHGDIFFHLKAKHRDVCFDFCRKVEVMSRQWPRQQPNGMLHIDGFLYRANQHTQLGKDLSLFEDGSANPDTIEDRISAACTKDGRSFCLAQQWVHDRMEEFISTEVEHQERHIGRTRDHSKELDPLPIHSHVNKVTVHDNEGNEIQTVRHSVPYGTLDEYGLFFVSYANNLKVFDTQLRRMAGEELGDQPDGLFQFSHAKTGAYFFIPSENQMKRLIMLRGRL